MAYEGAKQELSPVVELLFDSPKALLGNAVRVFLGGLRVPPRIVRGILGNWHGPFLDHLLEANQIVVGSVSTRNSRAGTMSAELTERVTKASTLTKALAGTVNFAAALPPNSQYRKMELGAVTKKVVPTYHALMEQLTKHSSLTPAFKQNYGFEEWFGRLPRMSLEEKFTLLSIVIQRYHPGNPSYLVLSSVITEKKKALRQKKKMQVSI